MSQALPSLSSNSHRLCSPSAHTLGVPVTLPAPQSPRAKASFQKRPTSRFRGGLQGRGGGGRCLTWSRARSVNIGMVPLLRPDSHQASAFLMLPLFNVWGLFPPSTPRALLCCSPFFSNPRILRSFPLCDSRTLAQPRPGGGKRAGGQVSGLRGLLLGERARVRRYAAGCRPSAFSGLLGLSRPLQRHRPLLSTLLVK